MVAREVQGEGFANFGNRVGVANKSTGCCVGFWFGCLLLKSHERLSIQVE